MAFWTPLHWCEPFKPIWLQEMSDPPLSVLSITALAICITVGQPDLPYSTTYLKCAYCYWGWEAHLHYCIFLEVFKQNVRHKKYFMISKVWISFIICAFSCNYIRIRKCFVFLEREHTRWRGERGKERDLKQAPHLVSWSGAWHGDWSPTLGWWPEPKSRVRHSTNWAPQTPLYL